MYNDFLGEAIAEETRTGIRRKANPNNPITKQRNKLKAVIDSQANELGRDKADISLEYVNANLPAVQRYVTTKGEQPRSNPVELSLQAFLLRQKDVKDIQKALSCDASEAETFLDEAESNSVEMNSSDSDNFIGDIFGAISNVAKPAVSKITEKRKASGKKPGIWGAIGDILGSSDKSATQVAKEATDGQGGGLKVFAKDVLDAIKKAEKKKEINKMLPYIIGGVILLILITVLITKNAAKNK